MLPSIEEAKRELDIAAQLTRSVGKTLIKLLGLRRRI